MQNSMADGETVECYTCHEGKSLFFLLRLDYGKAHYFLFPEPVAFPKEMNWVKAIEKLGQKPLTNVFWGDGVGWRPGGNVHSLSTQQAVLNSADVCCCGKKAVESIICISVPHFSVHCPKPLPEYL